jgi:phenylacetate-CoA ligase
MRRSQDYISDWLSVYAHSAFYPGRRERNYNIRQGINYRHFFYNLLPREQEQEILRTLQEIVSQARQTIPYYAEKLRSFPADFPRSWAEYRLLEPLGKKDINEKRKQLLNPTLPFHRLVACATSGSTGEPTTVYTSQADLGWRLAGEQYYYSLLDSSRGKRIARLYGGAVGLHRGSALLHKLKNWSLNRLHYDCLSLDEEYLMSVHASFTKFAPDLLIAYSSALYLLALLLERKAICPTYPQQAILCAAEKLEDYQRTVVERVFSVPVVERYGSRDIGQMAYQLPRQGLDFQIDRCACLIEPDGVPDENGVAPILVTTLRNQAMPLLRYRIEDLARFPLDWSPEQSVTSLAAIVGRTCDYILLPGNKKISGGMMDILFQDKEVQSYQVIQAADASVRVNIVPGPNFNGVQREQIQRLIRAHLSGVAVEFEYLSEIKRTTANAKLRPVISHLARSSSLSDQQSLASDVCAAQ